MKGVELDARVRYVVQIEGVSRRVAARRFGIDPRTVAKMLRFRYRPATGEAGRRRVRSEPAVRLPSSERPLTALVLPLRTHRVSADAYARSLTHRGSFKNSVRL
jgi:hypothetical protein